MAVRGQQQQAAEQQKGPFDIGLVGFLVFVCLYTFPSLKSITSHSSFMHEATETAANRENGAKATIEKASVMVEEEDEPASAASAATEKPNEKEKATPVETENSTATEAPDTQQSKPQEEKKTEENTPENSEKLEKSNEEGTQEGNKNETSDAMQIEPEEKDPPSSATLNSEKHNEKAEGTEEGSKNETTDAMQIEPEEKDPPSAAAATLETSIEEKKDTASSAATSTENKASAAAPPPPPVMKGTLSCDIDARRHLIRGMWNYENSNVFPPQPFELVRKLGDAEDKHKLPQDGTFHGSFRLAYFHTTSKGKQKERVKVIPETNVAIKFTQPDAQTKPNEYQVDGKGTNQFGIFHINGTATRSDMEGDNTLHVVLRKRYESSTTATTSAGATVQAKSNKSDGDDSGPLPEPAKSYPSGVVCLRGKVYKEESSAELGLDEMIQRISGMWSSGLDFILADPDNVRGLCNRFEYEHKSSQSGQGFPVSGRYSGWFDLSNEDGSRTRINERDVTLKFRKNREGFYNVEGKGSNVFGKYSITGTVTADNIITIFRHFQPRKLKTKATNSSEDGKTATAAPRRPSISAAQATLEAKLKLADVVLPADGAKVDPITPPITGTYSAVSRGVLRINGDGSHSCQGKWAVTREHFTNGQTSNFNFRLEAHFAADASTRETRKFPLNSPMYKGSFQLKKGGSRYQTIVDQQVVMKFAENNQGSFNVHGKGLNAIGEFNLLGTMVMSGKTGGQVELYRMYPPEKLAAPAPAAAEANGTVAKSSVASGLTASGVSNKPAIPAPPQGIQRRESTRMVKLPSRLEDDDPSAQLARIMDKCAQILRIIRERDVELGAFFSEPVDPVALGIPTYFQIIKHPMDLRTVHRKMESQQIVTPEDFARHVRLVFENAMTFNIDPTHSVHQAARSLLVLFNQKFRDVDRMIQNVRRTHGTDWDEKGRIKKSEKKRKRGQEETKSLKRLRLEEAEAMAAANASAVASLVAAAPSANAANVSRPEFNMLLHLIQQLQKQVVQTHTALADLCPGDENDAKIAASGASSVPSSVPSTMAPEPPKKKATKRKTPEPLIEVIEEAQPLNLAEQELLTETINDLPPEHLGGVIQIIREAAPVGADEDEIDLEIDQLDAKTQRKLLSHVSKVRPTVADFGLFFLHTNVLISFCSVVYEKIPRKRKEKSRFQIFCTAYEEGENYESPGAGSRSQTAEAAYCGSLLCVW